MDIAVVLFVSLLLVISFFVTMSVRRDLLARERRQREQERQLQPPRRKP